MCRRMTTSDGLQYAAWACLLCLLLLLASATAWASETPAPDLAQEATAPIKISELNELGQKLTELQQSRDRLQQASGRLKNQLEDCKAALTRAQTQLATARRQSLALQLQLTTLTEKSKEQERLLTSVNQSFEQYKNAQKRTRLRIKAQRNMWEVSAGLLLIGLITK